MPASLGRLPPPPLRRAPASPMMYDTCKSTRLRVHDLGTRRNPRRDRKVGVKVRMEVWLEWPLKFDLGATCHEFRSFCERSAFQAHDAPIPRAQKPQERLLHRRLSADKSMALARSRGHFARPHEDEFHLRPLRRTQCLRKFRHVYHTRLARQRTPIARPSPRSFPSRRA